MKAPIVQICLVIAAVLSTSGCMGNRVNMVTPTVGQELIDLQAARDKGALNDDEYNERRMAILSQDPRSNQAIASGSVSPWGLW